MKVDANIPCVLALDCISNRAKEFYAAHPNVIRPSHWTRWAEEAGLRLDTITDEAAFDALSKERDLEVFLNAPCKIFGEEKKVEDTRMHVYVPPGLSLQTLKLIAKAKFPQIPYHGKIPEEFLVVIQDVSEALSSLRTEGGWKEMTRRGIPGSKEKLFKEQKELVNRLRNKTGENYEAPKALNAAACIMAWYFNTNELIFEREPATYTDEKFLGLESFTRCQEAAPFAHYPVCVGNLCHLGLQIGSFQDNRESWTGVAVMRDLS